MQPPARESRGDGETRFQRVRGGFCKCKQLLLTLPAGCSAQLSDNRCQIIFIEARDMLQPPDECEAPGNWLLFTHVPHSPTFSSTRGPGVTYLQRQAAAPGAGGYLPWPYLRGSTSRRPPLKISTLN